MRRLVDAIQRSDDAAVERAVIQLSASSRWLAPLALIVGAFLMLFQRSQAARDQLAADAGADHAGDVDLGGDARHQAPRAARQGVQHPPRADPGARHSRRHRPSPRRASTSTASSPLRSPTAAKPQIRPAFAKANHHLRTILAWGVAIGLALVVLRARSRRAGAAWPFVISQSIVVGIMMICYLAVPARMVGIDTKKGARVATSWPRPRWAARSGPSCARRRTCSAASASSCWAGTGLLAGGDPHRRSGPRCRPA